MKKIEVHPFYAILAVVALAVSLFVFISLTDTLYIGITTPLLTFMPFFVTMAVSRTESLPGAVNMKVLSALAALLLLLVGILMALFDAAPVWFVLVNALIMIAWAVLIYPFLK